MADAPGTGMGSVRSDTTGYPCQCLERPPYSPTCLNSALALPPLRRSRVAPRAADSPRFHGRLEAQCTAQARRSLRVSPLQTGHVVRRDPRTARHHHERDIHEISVAQRMAEPLAHPTPNELTCACSGKRAKRVGEGCGSRATWSDDET